MSAGATGGPGGPTGPGGPAQRAAAYAARLDGLMAQVERIGREVAERERGTADARAEAARRGELGPAWRDVQERIDTGRTSLEAVFSGEDDSPAAQRLREDSRTRLATLAQDEERPDDVVDALAALQADRARVSAVLGTAGPAGPPGPASPAP